MSVFISYSTKDKQIADKLRTELTAKGIKVWSDALIKPGQSMAHVLKQAIDSSDTVLVVLSPESTKSANVSMETALALADRWAGKPKRIVPVLAAAIDEAPPFLRDLNWADLSTEKKFELNFDNLVEAIKVPPAKDDEQNARIARFETVLAERKLLDEEAKASVERQRTATLSILSSIAVVVVASVAGVLGFFTGTAESGKPTTATILAGIAGFAAGVSMTIWQRYLIRGRKRSHSNSD